MSLDNLESVYVNELKDVYHAENQLIKALPKMARASTSPSLQAALEEHLEQTRAHVERLEKIFESMDLAARGKKCAGMKGLIEEGSSIIKEDGEPEARDAALISAAQKVEHYEIAAYGCLATWASLLNHEDHVQLLQETLSEEKAADEKLTAIAKEGPNAEAAAEV